MSSPVSHDPSLSRRARAGIALALVVSLAGAAGCNRDVRRGPPRTATGGAPYPGSGLPSLSPPPQPIFLGTPEDRGHGPLQPAAESELELARLAVPPGTITVEKSAWDTDAILRIASPYRVGDARKVEHRETTRSIQAVGIVEDGFVRFRIGYPHDTSMWMDHGQKITKPSPVGGKNYLVDMSPSGIRVFTEKGTTPSGEEVNMIQDDFSELGRSPRHDEDARSDGPLRPGRAARGGPPPPQPASEVARAHLRKLLDNNQMKVDKLDVRLQGTRTVHGVPCALFSVAIQAKKQKASQEKTSSSALDLGGEYALRLKDGWEAELLLSGTVWNTTQMVEEGVPVTVTSAAFTRIFVQTSYTAPDPSTAPRTVDKLRREPSGH